MINKIKLNKILHQPIRTKIISLLASMNEADYTIIKKTLNLSDGHMSTHMKELVKNNYISFKKSFVKNKPLTTYKITKKGLEDFKVYLKNLKLMIDRIL